jgi:HSP20 family protein
MFSLIPWRRERTPAGTLIPREEPFRLMRREFESLFDRFFGGLPEVYPEVWGLETEEKPEEVVVRAELPGFELPEINVLVTGETLTIEAEHKEPEPKEGEEVGERRSARMRKTMTLPAGIEAAKVEARYHNGVLEVHLPRTPEARPRKIEVKA